MNSRVLDVYLKGNFVGKLTQSQGGVLRFSYAESYITKATVGISISLPLSMRDFEGDVVKTFFAGLLPEEDVRHRLAKTLGLSKGNIFALLEAIGGDCAGALALYSPSDQLMQADLQVEALDNAQLKEILDLIKRRPMLAGHDGYRLSLAGAQDKLAVRFSEGKILLVKNGAPTTHILKPVIEDILDSAHNELFCMRLANRLGIEVPKSLLLHVDGIPYYLVARYDRRIGSDQKVERIHQEDFCQALSIVPEMKYQSEGGPSLMDCQELIKNSVRQPALDQVKFLDRVIFNFLIGNADAHGKNFAFIYHQNKPELAPAYDLLSTAVYPELSKKMAMKIDKKYNPDEVCLRHWLRLVPETKLAQTTLSQRLSFMAIKVVEQAQELKNDLIQESITSAIFDDIIAVIKQRARRFSES